MTPEECVVLTAYIEELCPNQKISENTPDFWHDVLYRYPLDDCRAAVAAMVNDGRVFIDVARIAVDAKRIRDGRLANIDLATQPPGPVDELTYRTPCARSHTRSPTASRRRSRRSRLAGASG
jgi:hypothetical protein